MEKGGTGRQPAAAQMFRTGKIMTSDLHGHKLLFDLGLLYNITPVHFFSTAFYK
jgi:hypothetical protein